MRDTGNRQPDLVESGWSGRRWADNPRFLIALAFIVFVLICYAAVISMIGSLQDTGMQDAVLVVGPT